MFDFGSLRRQLFLVFAIILVLAGSSMVLSSSHLASLEQSQATVTELAQPYDRALAAASVAAKAAATDERASC